MSLADPQVELYCDGADCRASEMLRLRCLPNGCYDERSIPAQIERLGWQTDGDNHLCPDCVAAALEVKP